MSLALHFLLRAARTWLAARALVLAVVLFGGAPTGHAPYDLAPGAAVLMVCIAIALGVADVARRGERALLGNFGVSRAQLLLWLAVPALLGEVAVAALLRALR
ncbi:MAG: hypothetical protein ACXW61_09500 [Gemmatirosa sp.]